MRLAQVLSLHRNLTKEAGYDYSDSRAGFRDRVFAIVGILGLYAVAAAVDAPPLTVEHGHGMALGIFPVNTLHNIVHLLFAILGLRGLGQRPLRAATSSCSRCRTRCSAVLGLSSATNTTFGLIPIWGADVYLHARGRDRRVREPCKRVSRAPVQALIFSSLILRDRVLRWTPSVSAAFESCRRFCRPLRHEAIEFAMGILVVDAFLHHL